GGSNSFFSHSQRVGYSIDMKAIIIGAKGQDGTILQEYLRSQGYRLMLFDKDYFQSPLNTEDSSIKPCEITDATAMGELIKAFQPDEVYHLAAINFAAEMDKQPNIEEMKNMFDVNFFSLLNVLEGVRLHSPRSRVFFAASSHIFYGADEETVNEVTPLAPNSLYGMTKANGLWLCRMYREQYGVFASVGILFTHESHLRSEAFLSQKIVRSAVRIQQGQADIIKVGDLQARNDWGYAPDFIEAMHKILRHDSADEFVIATGETHSVQDFIGEAFGALGLSWQPYIQETPGLLKRKSLPKKGDIRKIQNKLQWSPRTSFREMIKKLVNLEQVKD
ncbi:MAG: GDP-mannose 4,6-dehydratase, partial [Pseudobdellovibrionaceae bacterium]